MQEGGSLLLYLSLGEVLLGQYVTLVGVILFESIVFAAEPDVLDFEGEGSIDAVGERDVHAGDSVQRQTILLSNNNKTSVKSMIDLKHNDIRNDIALF